MYDFQIISKTKSTSHKPSVKLLKHDNLKSKSQNSKVLGKPLRGVSLLRKHFFRRGGVSDFLKKCLLLLTFFFGPKNSLQKSWRNQEKIEFHIWHSIVGGAPPPKKPENLSSQFFLDFSFSFGRNYLIFFFLFFLLFILFILFFFT